MRLAFVCAMLVLPFLQAAAVTPAPISDGMVPTLSLTLSPAVVNVQSGPDTNASARFNGTATVDKPPMVRCVVTLTGSTDAGWPTEITPNTMVFGASGSQDYQVVVTIPGGSPSAKSNLTVDGRAVVMGLQFIDQVTVIIDVKGSAPLNTTGHNGTQGNTTRAAGVPAGGGSNILTVLAVAAILVAVPVSAYVIYRRRRRRSPEPEA